MVALDDLGAHKGERVREPVEARGCSLPFLTACSPDLNPIEEAFSKLEAALRREKARAEQALVGGIGRALDAVSDRDARGWFAHCGYLRRAQLP